MCEQTTNMAAFSLVWLPTAAVNLWKGSTTSKCRLERALQSERVGCTEVIVWFHFLASPGRAEETSRLTPWRVVLSVILTELDGTMHSIDSILHSGCTFYHTVPPLQMLRKGVRASLLPGMLVFCLKVRFIVEKITVIQVTAYNLK